MDVEIRSIESLAEIHQCETLQQKIWGFTDLSIVPHHVIRTTLHGGGILVGAFLNNELIGFAYSVPGFLPNSDGGSPILRQCSFMAGVDPSYRFRGLGYKIKLKQRELALAQGIDLVTWTFDPLQSSNANFNIRKLGVISQEYHRDYYGDMRDELNKGLPTDRFGVEWWIDSSRVRNTISASDRESINSRIECVNQTVMHDHLLEIVEFELGREDDTLSVEVLRNFAEVKSKSPDLALKWRMQTREIFENYLGKGYVVSEFLVEGNNSNSKAFYILKKRSLNSLLK
jgi:predicted GNAT superfamily acetyltransferase